MSTPSSTHNFFSAPLLCTKAFCAVAILITAMFLETLSAVDYYVDPINGSIANAGTSANPWSTLEDVFAVGKQSTFRGGDRLILRRGNHGGPVITGAGIGASITNPVTIIAQSGHAPVMRRLFLSGAKFWVIQDVFINHDLGPADTNALITLQNASDSNIIRNVGACSTQAPLGWAANEAGWSGARNGIEVKSGGGSYNTFERVYCLNSNDGIISADSNNLYQYNVVENFIEDGIRPNANYLKFYYNTVMNAVMDDHTKPYANRAHRDMWQETAGTVSGIEMVGNMMIAVADPTLPICDFDEVSTTKYMEVYLPVFAGWDGPFNSCVFENNVIFTNHSTGIWLNAASNCRIVNNTMLKISNDHPSFLPHIKIGSKTATSAPSANNVVYNNIAMAPPVLSNGGNTGGGTSSVSGSGNNITVSWANLASFFMSPYSPKLDARLSSKAVAAINTANASAAPRLDVDGNVRSTLPDIGAYEYGVYTGPDTVAPSIPGQPSINFVSGLGADLSWAASTDNRTVTGYDVYRNGARIGRARNGARFFDVYTGSSAGISYTIKAFDMSGNFSAASAPGASATSVSVPQITWATTTTPAAITYGTALSATQLNAQANTPGVFTYTPPIGTILSAGTQTLRVLFTPTDTAHFTTATASATIVVNKAISTIAWQTPLPITYGTPLSSNQLNATASVPGSLVYTPAAGTIVSAGTQLITVAFTPTNVNYTTATASISLTVNKALPIITWPTPSAITVGTALSATQLNATANVLGTFVYTPISGTTLTVGTQTLSTTFTPSSSNYVTTTASVNLVVNTTVSPPSPGFFMGINCNGPAVTIGGHTWLGQSTALTQGLTITTSAPATSPAQFGISTITPIPAVDAVTSSMLNSVVWASQTFSLSQTVPNGTYSLYLWCIENYKTNFRAFNVTAESSVVATAIGQLPFGTWNKYGPYNVSVTDGQLNLTLASTVGNPCLAGLELYTSGLDAIAPSIPTGVTATFNSSSSIQVSWNASTDNVGVTGYDIFNGAAPIGTTTTTSFIHSGLALATNYRYTVIAKDAAGNRSVASAPTTPLQTDPAFILGVNMNGGTVTINGNAWRSYSTALTQGLSLTAPSSSPVQLGTSAVIPNPSTDPTTTSMLGTVAWAATSFTVNQALPSGNYHVYLWFMENYQTNFRAFNVTMENSLVATGVGQLPFGGWKRYGPYATAISDGSLTMTLASTKGNPGIMGLEIYQVAPPSGIAALPISDHTIGSWMSLLKIR